MMLYTAVPIWQQWTSKGLVQGRWTDHCCLLGATSSPAEHCHLRCQRWTRSPSRWSGFVVLVARSLATETGLCRKHGCRVADRCSSPPSTRSAAAERLFSIPGYNRSPHAAQPLNNADIIHIHAVTFTGDYNSDSVFDENASDW